MKIPFMRLDRQYALHKDEILSICDNVFSHGRVLQGKEVDSLENKLSEIHRSKYSVLHHPSYPIHTLSQQPSAHL